jgi:hypothetical protein
MKRRMFAVPRHNAIEFNIVVEGDAGAIQFHFMSIDSRDPGIARLVSDNGQFMSLGVEMHKKTAKGEGNHEHCWLLNAPCYHDGTSLWASETVMPAFISGGCDAVYPLLESCYRDRFLTEPA